MAVLDTIAHEAREDVARIGAAGLVVAIPSCHSSEHLAVVVTTLSPVLAALTPDAKSVLLYPATAAASSGADAPAETASSCCLLPYPLPLVERLREESMDQSLQSLLRVGRALGARAMIMLSSDFGANTPGDLRSLAEPVLQNGYDLAVPTYPRRKLASLINTSIVYPLTRALYGMRLNYPMAVDVSVSDRLAEKELGLSGPKGAQSAGWVTTRGVFAGLQICQVYCDTLPAPPAGPESPDVSMVLAHVLSRLFLDFERTAGFWQKVRESQPVRLFGNPRAVEDEPISVDVQPMVETFQRGCRDLLEIWAPILSPTTLVELRKIARQLPPDRFRLGDELWAHVLYDFILGHRQRVISREHLLRALTPIYLGWVASYALEVRNLAPKAVDERLEALCVSLERLKPYLVSRWRSPDRFNP